MQVYIVEFKTKFEAWIRCGRTSELNSNFLVEIGRKEQARLILANEARHYIVSMAFPTEAAIMPRYLIVSVSGTSVPSSLTLIFLHLVDFLVRVKG